MEENNIHVYSFMQCGNDKFDSLIEIHPISFSIDRLNCIIKKIIYNKK